MQQENLNYAASSATGPLIPEEVKPISIMQQPNSEELSPRIGLQLSHSSFSISSDLNSDTFERKNTQEDTPESKSSHQRR